MPKLLTKILGDPGARQLKRLEAMVPAINAAEAKVAKLSDAKLRDQAKKFREELAGKRSLDDILPEAFATVREAAKRQLKQRHFDVQLIGGLVLHHGKIAEMRTGEGKTLVATLPVYLNALEGKGVHVVTVNDYLARRDAGWMAQVYHALGLTIGIITHDQAFLYDPKFDNEDKDDDRLRHLKPVERKEAYLADVTYGTNNEFGFDYLRDNMVDDPARMVQRPLHFAIVDEVDSILIDEARTPLIISAPAEESTDKYYRFAQIATGLTAETDYTVDEKLKAVSLTDEGMAKVERALGVTNLYESGAIDDVHHIEQALKAQAVFRLDRDYVVREGEVIIVDEFTGRLMQGRRYSEGLHQAIEAKEGVNIQQESLTLATITFQNYFRLYAKLAGMTGTALTESEEFHKIYNLDVVSVPTHRPMVRQDLADRIYKTQVGKFQAIAGHVKELHDKGQPVLLGTVSIEKNELLSSVLDQVGVPHKVLNAKNNEEEAGIIAMAGQPGAVTLATNIAGRGTDIVLGKGVAELGGLAVLGSERHESRRIDNQLRGRSGRQGDPGISQFYVSLEDDLMRIFGGERIGSLMTTLGIDENTPIENRMVSRSIEGAQKRVEGHNFDIRKQLVEYDDVMNRHREAIYSKRRRALASEDLRPEIKDMVTNELAAILQAHTDARTGEVDGAKIYETALGIMPLPNEFKGKFEKAHPTEITDLLNENATKLYEARIKEFGDDGMRLIERVIYLRVIDNLWIEHLEAMEGLREGIGLRAIGQRDPLVEYKREGYRLFQTLIATFEAEVANTIYKAAIQVQQEQMAAPVETALTKAAELATTASDGEKPKPKRREKEKSSGDKIGRNDLCPCGSGKKYKKCGLLNTAEHQANMAKQ